jgi:acetylornithine deacetylase/succinyl-diaminopimelate desuccinylase-like protein
VDPVLPVSGHLPSADIHPDRWELAHGELLEILAGLIRIPSINPPDPPGPETAAAHYVAAALADAGIRAEVVEPIPGRGSVVARLRGDGTGGAPILLLSHLDVVPATGEGWQRDPFGGEIADGYLWGRGAVDMKSMVAMEVVVLRLLAAVARSAGRDPAHDPVPGLRRDVLFAATADEEAGGRLGAGWLVDHRPEALRAAVALNEGGGFSFSVGGRRLYGVGVAERGYAVVRVRVRGAWGHGSMPRPDNALVLAGRVAARINEQGPPVPSEPVRPLLHALADALPPGPGAALRRAIEGDPSAEADVAAGLDPSLALALAAILRDTASPNVLRVGVKYNVIPGAAELEVDGRTLPGHDPAGILAELRRRIGEELWGRCEAELVASGPPLVAPVGGAAYRRLVETLRAHDPAGIPVPLVTPFATDAKHLARLGTPSYGFQPLRLAPDEPYLARFHGINERVGLDALQFGLPVLYDAVVGLAGEAGRLD